MLKKENAQKKIDKQKAFHREWLRKPGSIAMKSEAQKYILEDLRDDSPSSMLNISDSLLRLGIWYGAAGNVLLTDNNTAGWMDIHRSWLHLTLALRIRISIFEKARVPPRFRPIQSLETEASLSALCLAYALVIDRNFQANSFGDTLRTMLIDRERVRDEYWKHHYTEAFVLQLLTFTHKNNLNVAEELGRSCGVYQNVIDAWDRPSLLETAISDACDFHCNRIEDNSDKFTAEFRSPPFDLVPAEILAIYAVREKLGLETPRVAHPLLEAPFENVVGSPDDIQDSLLNEVEGKL